MILAQSFITKEVGHLAPEPFWENLAFALRLLSHLCASRLCASSLRASPFYASPHRRPLCASRLAPLAFAPLAFAPLAFAPRNSRLVVFPSRSPFFFLCGNISLHLLWDRIRGPIHTRNPPSEDHALDLDQPSIEVYSGPCES